MLRRRLDSLGDEVETEGVAEVDDPFQKHEVGSTGVDRVGEAAVDLDDVDREALQVGERRVAGAEVVERERDAARLQCREPLLGVLARREQDALGQLERQAVRREAGVGERLLDVGDELGMLRAAARRR